MPTYIYRCAEGHISERQQSIHDPLPVAVNCTTCDAAIAKRVFTPPAAIHFKGGGFYDTDYRLRYDRKRRPNAGDSLPIPTEAAITRAEGAEYDPPKNMPGVVHRKAA